MLGWKQLFSFDSFGKLFINQLYKLDSKLRFTTSKMNFIILFAIIQGSIAGRISKRLLPAQAQLPDKPYEQDAGMVFQLIL